MRAFIALICGLLFLDFIVRMIRLGTDLPWPIKVEWSRGQYAFVTVLSLSIVLWGSYLLLVTR